MASKTEVMVSLQRLVDAYNYDIPERQREVYLTELMKCDRVRIHNAAVAIIQTSKFFPRLAEIMAKIREQDPSHEGVENYPAVLPQEKNDRELIWRMCLRNISNPYQLTDADMKAAGA